MSLRLLAASYWLLVGQSDRVAVLKVRPAISESALYFASR